MTISPPLPVRARTPQLIATDLDGTFLSPDGTVSAENAAAVLAAQEAGIPVVIATGRPVRWLGVIKDLPGAHPTVIASNGAVLYDLGTGQVLDRICLRPDVAMAAVHRLRVEIPGVSFAFESGTRFGYEPTYRTWAPDDGTNPELFSAPAEELAYTGDHVKMLIQSHGDRADDLLATVRGVVGDTLTATHSAAGDHGLVEVSAAGVSKASMLQRTCARLGVDARDVAAFGDMPNDVDMLAWVGMPYVVDNGHPALHAMDFGRAPGNDQSGVGRTIMSWLEREPGR